MTSDFGPGCFPQDRRSLEVFGLRMMGTTNTRERATGPLGSERTLSRLTILTVRSGLAVEPLPNSIAR